VRSREVILPAGLVEGAEDHFLERRVGFVLAAYVTHRLSYDLPPSHLTIGVIA
jgi:hypothetical protein